MPLKLLEYGLIAFAFLLPWQTRLILQQGAMNGAPWEYGTFSIYFTEFVLWIILALSISVIARPRLGGTEAIPSLLPLTTGLLRRSFRLCRNSLLAMTLVAFLVWGLLSIIWSPSPIIAFRVWFALAEGIGLFWLLIRIPFQRYISLYVYNKKFFPLSLLLGTGLGILKNRLQNHSYQLLP